MLLISNNALKYLPIPEDAVIRINMAWCHDKKELYDFIEANRGRTIFLDYPCGRTKPPTPTLTIEDAKEMMKAYSNIRYFAVSNSEIPSELAELRKYIDIADVEIVPKIESAVGVLNLENICIAAESDIVMLDKEDLYTSVHRDDMLFDSLVQEIRKRGKSGQIRILELEGVLFSEHKEKEAEAPKTPEDNKKVS